MGLVFASALVQEVRIKKLARLLLCLILQESLDSQMLILYEQDGTPLEEGQLEEEQYGGLVKLLGGEELKLSDPRFQS